MSRKVPKGRLVLKVTVSFEASRMADECLADAYEQVVPLVSRVTPALATKVDPDQTRPAVGDVVGFEPSDSGKKESVTNSKRSSAL